MHGISDYILKTISENSFRGDESGGSSGRNTTEIKILEENKDPEYKIIETDSVKGIVLKTFPEISKESTKTAKVTKAAKKEKATKTGKTSKTPKPQKPPKSPKVTKPLNVISQKSPATSKPATPRPEKVYKLYKSSEPIFKCEFPGCEKSYTYSAFKNMYPTTSIW